jgi:hypothetical protein
MKKRVASAPISEISSSSMMKSPRRLDIEAFSPRSTMCTNCSIGISSRAGSAPSAATAPFMRAM